MEERRPKNGRANDGGGKKTSRRGGGNKSSVLEYNQLIEMLKLNKVEHFKNGEVEIRFSQLAFMPEIQQTAETPQDQGEDIEELLYYSAPPRRQN